MPTGEFYDQPTAELVNQLLRGMDMNRAANTLMYVLAHMVVLAIERDKQPHALKGMGATLFSMVDVLNRVIDAEGVEQFYFDERPKLSS